MTNLRLRVATLFVAAGCVGDSGEPATDVATPDTALDASPDAALDATPDAPACAPVAVPDPHGALPEQVDPPPVLGAGGDAVFDEAGWACRRPLVRDTLLTYVYGHAPDLPTATTDGTTIHDRLDDTELRWEEVEVRIDGTDLVLHVALFLPDGPGPHPIFVGQNACGNQSLSQDPAIRPTDAFRAATCGEERGGRADRFPIRDIVDRGYALATWHESEVAPDDVRLSTTQGVFGDPALVGHDWGVLAAWAWGASAVVSAVTGRDDIDATRVAVFGHSRRGKVALLAGALDERVALVVSHQSGTAGATLSRSDLGESVEAITTFFPHWFNDVFPEFAGRETSLPFDQHWLIALSAPRAVLVTNGADDDWADPPGALRAVELADPVWEVLGSPGLVSDETGPTLAGPLARHVRPGGHSIGAVDWQTFMDFADLHLR